MTTVALIPARQHSRRLPGKNLAEVGGVSLLARAVAIALQAKALGVVDDVVVSCEDRRTLAAAAGAGAVAHMRDEAARSEAATVVDVLRDFLTAKKTGYGYWECVPWDCVEHLHGKAYDLVCLLLPTSPLRTLRHVVESRLLLREGADAVMSVTPFRQDVRYACVEHDGQVKRVGSEHWTPETVFLKHDGTVIWARASWLNNAKDFYDGRIVPYPIPSEESADVDTPLDLDYARFLLERRERAGS